MQVNPVVSETWFWLSTSAVFDTNCSLWQSLDKGIIEQRNAEKFCEASFDGPEKN